MIQALRQQFGGWRWVGAAAFVAAVIWLATIGPPDDRLHVYFLDVGQGDADNSFGHPHPDVLRRLAEADVAVFRTDRHGRIEVISDGRTLQVKSQRLPSAQTPKETP